MMANRSKWTKAEWEVIAKKATDMYAAGTVTHVQVAVEVGCSPQTVRNILYGLKPARFKAESD